MSGIYVNQILRDTSADLKLAIVAKSHLVNSKQKIARVKLFIEINDVKAQISDFTYTTMIYLIDIMKY